MTNVLNQKTITIDEEGIISTVPICLRKATIIVNAAADAATFAFWNESDTAVSSKVGQTTSVTASSRTFSSTGNFPTATINPSQIIKVSYSATAENLYTMQIATNADNNTITVDPVTTYHGTITDDTNQAYSWKVWNSYTAFTIKAPSGTPKVNHEVDFGDKGYWFPNLAMHTLSTSATLELLLK
jgi:hypothetical protein